MFGYDVGQYCCEMNLDAINVVLIVLINWYVLLSCHVYVLCNALLCFDNNDVLFMF